VCQPLAPAAGRCSAEGSGEAELVAVGVGHVEEPLAPRSVSGGSVGNAAGGHHPGVGGVDVVHPQDHPPPDAGDGGVVGVELEVHEPFARPQGGERGTGAPEGHLEAHRLVERHRAVHVRHGEGDGAEGVNGGGFASWLGHVRQDVTGVPYTPAVPRFIHTADWQLGMTRRFLSPEAQARFTAARIDAIRTIGRLAIEHGAAFVVVGGDVFETNQVDRQIVVRTLDALGDFPTVTFYLLPGNHDPLDAGSVFTSQTFTKHVPANVVVLGDSTPIPVTDGLEIVGAPWFSKRPDTDLVARATVDLPANGTLRVVVGHGGVDTLAPDPDNPALISVADLEAGVAEGRFHYVALGDRHSTTPVGASGRIHYSGAPEPTDFREVDPGNVLLVDLDTSGVSVEPLRTGTWRFALKSFDVVGPDDCARVASYLDDLDDKQTTVVKLALVGTLSLAAYGELEATFDHHRDLLAGLVTSESRSDLAVLPDEADLAAMDLKGFGREALEELFELAKREDDEQSETAQRALELLYRLQQGVA
jgi:DNA repair exonuclease SbcCD nuclease subunit